MSKENRKNRFDVLVIGAGAAGLMAAITAARQGVRTAILDHHQTPGKKILSTGNGKCNFTNTNQNQDCFYSEDPGFVGMILEKFGAEDTISFFRELGVWHKSRDGYCYPRSGQAATIREALLKEAEFLGVKLYQEIGIQSVKKDGETFLIQTKTGPFYANSCILATGGKSAAKTGSDGSGYIYAKALGHTIVKPLPALVPLVGNESWFKETSGVRCDGKVELWINQELCCSDTGEIQMTDYGISGIPVFQVSRYAARALEQGSKVVAKLDFVPEASNGQLMDELYYSVDCNGNRKNWYGILNGICNGKIAAMICKKLKLSEDIVRSANEKTIKKQISQIVRQLKSTEVRIVDTRSFDQAQVTCGGVAINEIDHNMESKLVPGLYFAGEILDVDAICGGYNLQWAWSTGYIAGRAATNKR